MIALNHGFKEPEPGGGEIRSPVPSSVVLPLPVSLALLALIALWWVILPAIGLLYCLGVL